MALREEVEGVRAAIAKGDADGASEQEAKAWFITPIVEALGWRGRDRVRLDYSPNPEHMQMDYALRGPDETIVALIEATAPGQDLGGRVTQTLNDAFRAGIPLCVLTTGVNWWLYLLLDERSALLDRYFAKLDVRTDPLEALEDCLTSCLGYEAVVDGTARVRARQLLDDRRNEECLLAEIPRVWRRLLEGPDDLLVELVQEEVERAVDLRPSVKQVAAVIQGRAAAGSASPTVAEAPRDPPAARAPRPQPVSSAASTGASRRLLAPARSRPPPPRRGRSSDLRESARPSRRGSTQRSERVRMGYRRPSIGVLNLRSWKKLLLDVARRSTSAHAFDRFHDASRILRGTQGACMSFTNSPAVRARMIRTQRRIGRLASISLETNFSRNDVCDGELWNLLQHFGHSSDDLEIVYLTVRRGCSLARCALRSGQIRLHD